MLQFTTSLHTDLAKKSTLLMHNYANNTEDCVMY